MKIDTGAQTNRRDRFLQQVETLLWPIELRTQGTKVVANATRHLHKKSAHGKH